MSSITFTQQTDTSLKKSTHEQRRKTRENRKI